MDDESGTPDTGLPASIEAAWGLRERPARGPRRALSLSQIVQAGVRVAGSDGLAAVSMARVATELGSKAMSLYRYVAAKDELLLLMVDAAYGSPPDVPVPGEGWRAGLTGWAIAERAVLGRHPWIPRVPIGGPPATPNLVGWLERGLRCLRDTGLAEGEKLGVILLVTGFVRTESMLMSEVNAAVAAGGATPDEAMAAYGRLLARLTDRENYPAIDAILAAGVFAGPDDPNAEFDFGLERVLDGVDALVRARSASTPTGG